MAIKCHSAYVHYNMIHDRNNCCDGGGNFGSVFNIKYNCNGGTNFWGGLGAGLGMGLGNMLGGLCNWFGGFGMNNMFGGFGMGNMFGGFGGFGDFGLGGFGGFSSPFGGGFGSGWGSGWGNGLSGLFGGKNKTDKTDKSDKETKTVTDIDNGKINDLVAKGDKLIAEAKETDKSKEIQELLDEIDNRYKKDNDYKFEDEINTSDNKKQLELLIERLKAAKTTPVAAVAAVDPADSKVVAVPKVTAAPAADSAIADLGGEEEKKAETTDWNKINNIEDYSKLKAEEQEKITENKAKQLINSSNSTNIKKDQTCNNTYIINNLDVPTMKSLAKAGYTVKYGLNNGENITYKYIHGTIEIKTNENNNLTEFTIKNSTFKNEMGLDWTFVPKNDTDGTCTIKRIANPSQKTVYIAPNFHNREYKTGTDENYMVITDTATASKYKNGSLDDDDIQNTVKNSSGNSVTERIALRPNQYIEVQKDGKYAIKDITIQ